MDMIVAGYIMMGGGIILLLLDAAWKSGIL